jgi:hypothetical protein
MRRPIARSALPLSTDIVDVARHFRKVPTTDIIADRRHSSEVSLGDIALRLRHVCSCCRTRLGSTSTTRNFLKGAQREPPTKTETHCHLYRSVVIEPVSANRLHENGNFCGLGWRLSVNSRQGCRFSETRDFGQSRETPIIYGTFNQ